MRKIIYSPDYKEKLLRLRNELDLKYGQKKRQSVLAEIDQHLKHLKQFPFLGISVQAMYGIECNYYFLRAVKNVIFYEVTDKQIQILNMYSEREDYIIKFLGSRSTLQEK